MAAAIAGSVVAHWTNDHGVLGSNLSGANFGILHFVRDPLFPLLKNSVGYLSHESILLDTTLPEIMTTGQSQASWKNFME